MSLNQNSLVFRTGKEVLGACFSLLLGIVGGALCGAAILVFGGLIGRSGSTGAEYLGYWDIAEVWLGFLYGGLFGAILGPIAYGVAVRKTGFRRAILPAFAGTLAGGMLGALASPPAAVFSGVGGFFIGILWAAGLLIKE